MLDADDVSLKGSLTTPEVLTIAQNALGVFRARRAAESIQPFLVRLGPIFACR